MTAVEWLIMQLPVSIRVELYKKNIHLQAKEMEKQQIIDAYRIGECEVGLMIVNKPEQYYNETYGSKGSEITSSQTTSEKWKEYQDWLNEEHHEDKLVEKTYTEEQLKLAYMQGYNRGVLGTGPDMESYIEFIKQSKL